jgi:RsiW-degrading membrane proteinase PrsW (M82 family)
MLHTVAVLAVSVAPALAFLVLILALDRREPEPLALVLKVIGLGAASAVAAALVEFAIQAIPLFGLPGVSGAAAVAFIQVAPAEEACKLAVVLFYAWRKPAFNEENDGIVYAGASAIGFALLENVIYVARFGLGTGAARAFSAIPLHVFTAVLVGLHVGRARFAASHASRNGLVLRGFALAWLVHGLYDMLAMSGSALALLLLPLLAGLATFAVLALRKGRRLSLARWGSASGPVEPAPVAPEPVAPNDAVLNADAREDEKPRGMPTVPRGPSPPAPAHRWMPVVARTLLSTCALFWILLAAGLVFGEAEAEPGSAVLGGVTITILPISLGAALELGWQRQKRKAEHRAALPVGEGAQP